jgi:hypothetical protein
VNIVEASCDNGKRSTAKLGVRIWRLNRVASAGPPCLGRTGFAGYVRSKALPKSVRWLCWLEQA